MNFRGGVGNNYYGHLTLVWVFIILSPKLAAEPVPSLNPDLPAIMQRQNEKNDRDPEKEQALDSLTIKESEGEIQREPLFEFLKFMGKNKLILSTGAYYGPYDEQNLRFNSQFGAGYQIPINPSQRYEFTFDVGYLGERNPLFRFSHETQVYNSWTFLKAYHWDIQIEWSAKLSYASILRTNQYSFGGGLTLFGNQHPELRISVFPHTKSPIGVSLALRWLLSGF